MTAEIFGDGDFVSRITVGNRLKVTIIYNFIKVIFFFIKTKFLG